VLEILLITLLFKDIYVWGSGDGLLLIGYQLHGLVGMSGSCEYRCKTHRI